jgi:hypothetical protein
MLSFFIIDFTQNSFDEATEAIEGIKLINGRILFIQFLAKGVRPNRPIAALITVSYTKRYFRNSAIYFFSDPLLPFVEDMLRKLEVELNG